MRAEVDGATVCLWRADTSSRAPINRAAGGPYPRGPSSSPLRWWQALPPTTREPRRRARCSAVRERGIPSHLRGRSDRPPRSTTRSRLASARRVKERGRSPRIDPLMRARGLEPPRAEAQRDLNPPRLPVPPRPRGARNLARRVASVDRCGASRRSACLPPGSVIVGFGPGRGFAVSPTG
jgi:hypothetical protein